MPCRQSGEWDHRHRLARLLPEGALAEQRERRGGGSGGSGGDVGRLLPEPLRGGGGSGGCSGSIYPGAAAPAAIDYDISPESATGTASDYLSDYSLWTTAGI